MNVGFTGTQVGMTGDQGASVIRLLHHLRSRAKHPSQLELWHGDCVGADEQADELARIAGWQTRALPGPNEGKRAHANATFRNEPMLDNLKRNKVIAGSCDPIIAAPSGIEIIRSGTWSTVRYARHDGKTVYIVRPDGKIDKEWPDARLGGGRRKFWADIDLRRDKP